MTDQLLSSLIQAERGSWFLDNQIFLALHPHRREYDWMNNSSCVVDVVTGKPLKPKPYSVSLDAALDLCDLNNWMLTALFSPTSKWGVTLNCMETGRSFELAEADWHQNRVLALLIALLRAKDGDAG